VKIRALLLDTARELLSRRTLLVYFGIVTLTHLVLLLALQTDVANGAVTSLRVFGVEGHASPNGFAMDNSAMPPGMQAEDLVRYVQIALTWVLYPIGVMLAVFATASLVPHMLEKGTIDLLLSKPVSRPVLFGARYLGALLIAGANLLYFVGGIGVILALKTGVWNGGFFLSGLLMTVYFGSLLGFLVLCGALLRSTTIAIMAAALVYLVSLAVAAPHANADWPNLITSHVGRFATVSVVEVLYHALPRTFEMGTLITSLVLHRPIESWAPVFWTMLSGGTALALAILWFRRADF
jgi:ABC-type transport system involved in multi-copper enzyme maturation permease subunit